MRLAFFGWGNSARAVTNAVRMAKEGKDFGIWHKKVGGLNVSDVDIACAFDVDSTRLGKSNGVEVFPGIGMDQRPAHVQEDKYKTADADYVERKLKELKVDMAFNLVSSGQNESSRGYARLCSKLGIAFANGTSASIVKDSKLVRLFENNDVLLAGDDLMSQLGGTVLHRGIVDFISSRGVKVTKSYQLDVGGSTDTLNTIYEDVRAQKRKIKSQSIASESSGQMETVAGTTDYVDFLGSRRTVYLWLECEGPMQEKFTIDIFYKSSDPANAVNVVLDVVRAMEFERKKGSRGVAEVISAYAFKNPPRIEKAREALEKFEKTYVE